MTLQPNSPVAALGLSTRALRCLTFDNIVSLGDLVQKTRDELAVLPNMGGGTLDEIEATLAAHDLALGVPFIGWPERRRFGAVPE